MAPKWFISLVILCIIVLSVRFFSFFQHIPTYADGQEIHLQVILQETPELSNRGQRFIVKTPENQRISIQTDLNELYHFGDSLAIQGSLQVTKMESGYEFLSMYYPEIVVLEDRQNPLFEASGWVRERSLALISSVLPSISSSLLLGIIFGSNEHFPDDFMESMRSTGVLHVIAASGMNVAFFVGAVLFSLGRLFTRRTSLLLAIVVVILYSFLVGFQPSILRAAIMAMIAITASFFGRQNLALFALFVTGFVLLFWSPAFLWDVGFQLSFMATLGILLINSRLNFPLRQGFAGQGFAFFAEDLKTTLSAQAGTLPILLGTFGSVGVLSVLVNVLILWTVPILMVLGVLGVVIGLIFAPIGKIIIFLTIPFLWFFETAVSFFGGFGLNFVVDEFPWQLTVGYYFVLSSFLVWMSRKQRIMKHESRSKGNKTHDS
ncbi:MAG TPA: ComEC/Rec2 family competence protein [Patescibacteria group bacterium]|nr:ComEC/Rec2 family competence protein [Patescibacteria group bacterium]